MSIQPKTKFEELIGTLTTYSKDKVLSEFELNRFLVQAKSIASISPSDAWHIKGLAYYYANQADEMKHAFTNAIKLKPNDKITLNNAVACSMNNGQILYAFDLLRSNSNFFISQIKDFDLVLKLSKMALNFYDFSLIDEIIFILNSNIQNDENIASLIETILNEYDSSKRKLQHIDVTWVDANKISKIAFSIIEENKLRPSSVVEVNLIEHEIFNTVYTYGSLENILKINDILFNRVYEQGYLEIWNKLMFTYSVSPKCIKDVV